MPVIHGGPVIRQKLSDDRNESKPEVLGCHCSQMQQRNRLVWSAAMQQEKRPFMQNAANFPTPMTEFADQTVTL